MFMIDSPPKHEMKIVIRTINNVFSMFCLTVYKLKGFL